MPATTGQILGKAHKLCEWLLADDIKLYPQVSSITLAHAVANATKWHVGKADEWIRTPSKEIFYSMPLRLPAEQILFEVEFEDLLKDRPIGKTTLFALCSDLKNESIRGFFFLNYSTEFRLYGGGMIAAKNGKILLDVYGRFGGDDEKDAKAVNAGFQIVLSVIAALNCTNVRSVDHEPHLAINKKRQKVGKPPIFTYKTLHILAGARSGIHNKRDDNDEAKRSPRLHFRRGHIRRISGDRMTLVQPCMVGDQRSGMVKKAYALVPQNKANKEGTKP